MHRIKVRSHCISFQHCHQSWQQRLSESPIPWTTFLPVHVEKFYQTAHLHHILLSQSWPITINSKPVVLLWNLIKTKKKNKNLSSTNPTWKISERVGWIGLPWIWNLGKMKGKRRIVSMRRWVVGLWWSGREEVLICVPNPSRKRRSKLLIQLKPQLLCFNLNLNLNRRELICPQNTRINQSWL